MIDQTDSLHASYRYYPEHCKSLQVFATCIFFLCLAQNSNFTETTTSNFNSESALKTI